MRRIAVIAATLAVLSGCGGEAKKDTFTAGEWGRAHLRISHSSVRAIGDAAELAAGILGPSWVEEDIWDYSDALEKLAAAPPSSRSRLRARVRHLSRLASRIQRRMRAIPVTGQVPAEQS